MAPGSDVMTDNYKQFFRILVAQLDRYIGNRDVMCTFQLYILFLKNKWLSSWWLVLFGTRLVSSGAAWDRLVHSNRFQVVSTEIELQRLASLSGAALRVPRHRYLSEIFRKMKHHFIDLATLLLAHVMGSFTYYVSQFLVIFHPRNDNSFKI